MKSYPALFDLLPSWVLVLILIQVLQAHPSVSVMGYCSDMGQAKRTPET